MRTPIHGPNTTSLGIKATDVCNVCGEDTDNNAHMRVRCNKSVLLLNKVKLGSIV